MLTDRQLQNLFDKILIIPGGCHEWMGAVGTDGYGHFRVDGKVMLAHRVAFMVEHGYEPEGFVIHSCDNKTCVNPAHLREGTDFDNKIDRAQRGPLNDTNQKLTPKDVKEIRHLLFLDCYSQAEIGLRYDVSRQTISCINTGKNWSHV